MIGGIVLAAGAATRMGKQKMLLPFAGTTVIECVVKELAAGGIKEITVVTGADAPSVEAVLATSPVTVVHNTGFTSGMLSSVRTGLSAAPAHWTAALVALGDQPLISHKTIRTILDAHVCRPDCITVPAFKGRRGHPVVLPRAFWEEALTKHDAVGLRGLLRAHSGRTREVTLDTADVLFDMDTPDDYRGALARLAERDDASPA